MRLFYLRSLGLYSHQALAIVLRVRGFVAGPPTYASDAEAVEVVSHLGEDGGNTRSSSGLSASGALVRSVVRGVPMICLARHPSFVKGPPLRARETNLWIGCRG